MLRLALSVGWVALASAAFAAAPPSVPNTHPQGQERSPSEREFFAPIQAPSNLVDVAVNPKSARATASALAFGDWLQQFQRPLGLAKGLWLVRR